MTSQHDMKESSSSVLISINDKLGAISSSPKHTIHKVHELLRTQNEKAYEPEIVSIGPYHRGKPGLRAMEERKLRWFKARLSQLGESDATEYVEAMKSLEPVARKCYSERTDDVDADEFAEMLLLDGCFIIQLMSGFVDGDPFFEAEWVHKSIIRDIILFENQIPLFVLEKLFSMIKLPQDPPIRFHDFALDYLTYVLRSLFSTIPTEEEIRPNDDDHIHILAFLHDLLRSVPVTNNTNGPSTDKTKADTNGPSIDETKADTNSTSINEMKADTSGPSSNETEADTNGSSTDKTKAKWNVMEICRNRFGFMKGWFDQRDGNIDLDYEKEQKEILNTESIPSAAKLQAAGVRFRHKKVRSSPFDISFKCGVIEIPTFHVNDDTECVYRNLIAYEQYNLKGSNCCVGLHAKLMDCLIDSAEDVALLARCGIICNLLGDDETVSKVFNKLTNNVIVGNSESQVHRELFRDVNKYGRKHIHKWMAKLKLDYFNSPWALVSFMAAFLLLVLTITQTGFSALSVV